MPDAIPSTQTAVQLTGPSELKLNNSKEVHSPTDYQVLLKVEATGLCFSDLKLLKQFSDHPRKSEVVSGIEPEEANAIPSYVPGSKPTVPGHETCGTIIAVGEKVEHHKVGERCLVQTDYRSIKTAGGSNAAFGYNFEGGLQQYVIIDERVSRDPATGERFLIPVGKERSASAISLAEPWACVEDSYLTKERQCVKSGGNLLLIVDSDREVKGLEDSMPEGAPAIVTLVADGDPKIPELDCEITTADDLSELNEASFDDIIYFGSQKDTIEKISPLLAPLGIANIVLAGKKIGASANIGVGRIHYGMTRWIGTLGDTASDSYDMIPDDGELRPGDSCLIIGAGGPMGQMHVIRNVCAGVEGVSVLATDFDEPRLDSLRRLASPMAEKAGVDLAVVNPQNSPIEGTFSYIAIMVPIAKLVQQAIVDADDNCLVNIFAGIPAPTIAEIDLDTLIAKRCFLFGTSGSTLQDMKVVLKKVEEGSLDTNASVDAISGLAGAIDGIAAVENRTLAGKCIVYPDLPELGLTPLDELEEKMPNVAAKLNNGIWTVEAEKELLSKA